MKPVSRKITGREHSDRNREARYYRLTATGKKHLTREHSKWRQLARAIGLVMKPVR